MPHLDQSQIIKGYWEEVKDQYPELTFQQFYDICQAPAKYTTNSIKDTRLPRIHIKFLGDFKVFPLRIIKKLRDLEKWKEKGIVTEEYYNERKAFFLNYQEEIKKLERDLNDLEPNIEIIDDTETEDTTHTEET